MKTDLKWLFSVLVVCILSFECSVGMPRFSVFVCLMKDQKHLGFVLRLSPMILLM